MQTARLVRFRRVLAAALGTTYYRPWLEAALLDSLESIYAVDNPAEVLRRLPEIEADLYLAYPERFCSPAGDRRRPIVLTHPLPGKPRIAVLTGGFRTSHRIRCFPNGLDGSLARFRPQIIAGPPARLEQLGQAIGQGVPGVSPTHGVLVLLHPDQPLLGPEPRARLWAWFGVPVFQQVLGFDGELLAWECEAHSGLHIVEEAAMVETRESAAGPGILLSSLTDLGRPMLRLLTPWQGLITRRVCGCGRPGERIVHVEERVRRGRDEDSEVLAGCSRQPIRNFGRSQSWA